MISPAVKFWINPIFPVAQKSQSTGLDNDENIFHNSLHDYYQIRPEDEDEDDEGSIIFDGIDNDVDSKWEKKCLADFVAKFNIAYKKDKNAMKYDRLSYLDVLSKDLRVMDASAISLARENKIPIIVCSIIKDDNLNKVLKGQGTFTLITD